jgi:hypothetical protein
MCVGGNRVLLWRDPGCRSSFAERRNQTTSGVLIAVTGDAGRKNHTFSFSWPFFFFAGTFDEYHLVKGGASA